MTLRDDYDSPWKDILGEYFEQFMRFFFPEIAAEIDWERGYEPADKEHRQITREAEIGRRLADRLFRVWKQNGDETWVMTHVEVQAQKEDDFPGRTYVCNYRIRDLYDKPAVSLAVLADENEKWRPTSYVSELWGCRTEFRFPMVKVLDYGKDWEGLEKSGNPFAIVVMAHLRTMETKGDNTSRLRWKTGLTRNLYGRGFGRQDILNLYRFIDWIMALPEELEETYHREIIRFEEEQKMQYVTTAERIGRKEGREEGSLEKARETARNLLMMGVLTHGQIASATGLTSEEVGNLQKEMDGRAGA